MRERVVGVKDSIHLTTISSYDPSTMQFTHASEFTQVTTFGGTGLNTEDEGTAVQEQ